MSFSNQNKLLDSKQLMAYSHWLAERGLASLQFSQVSTDCVESSQTLSQGAAYKVCFVTDIACAGPGIISQDTQEQLLFEKLSAAVGLSKQDYILISMDLDPSIKGYGFNADTRSLLRLTDLNSNHIVVFGIQAATALLGKRIDLQQALSRSLQIGDKTIYVTFHPRDMVRYPQHKIKTWNQLKMLKEVLTQVGASK